MSEGRSDEALAGLRAACGSALLDVHRDAGHHRAVLTLAGAPQPLEAAVRRLVADAVSRLDLSRHEGGHPRFGVVDVVPFVPLETSGEPPGVLSVPASLEAAVDARDRFARWAAEELDLPCFLYGPLPGGGSRTLPDVRRRAFTTLAPDIGPPQPNRRAGACAVGARGFLVAYNLWLDDGPGALAVARSVAAAIRGPAVRALGLDIGGRAQVSCNLVDPLAVGPATVHDRVASLAEAAGSRVEHCELVGLVPEVVRAAVPPGRWRWLDLDGDRTIEDRLGGGGLPSPASRLASWR